jgi:transposase
MSARNGGITVIAGIDDTTQENRCDSVQLPPYSLDLNPMELVCGDIRHKIAQVCKSVNLKELQVLCEKVFAEYIKGECQKLLLACEEVRRGIWAVRWHIG